MTELPNVYEDGRRAESYSKLTFPGTYYLAFRDLPGVFERHVEGTRAVDFGCGTGRSTRFLRDLGFECVGVDTSEAMLRKARELDPDGDYRLVAGETPSGLETGAFDLVLSTFTFDNIPTLLEKERALSWADSLLTSRGRIVSVVSSPDMYVNEWASFSTKEFPENRLARSGDRVLIVMLDVEDARPVVDVVCSREDYEALFERCGMSVVEMLAPLAGGHEPIAWKSEMKIAPWNVYVLAPHRRKASS